MTDSWCCQEGEDIESFVREATGGRPVISGRAAVAGSEPIQGDTPSWLNEIVRWIWHD